MKPLKAAATTSQPVLTSQQIETIFFKVPELYEIHKEFYDGLFPRVQQWSHQQRVGDLFQKLVSQLGTPALVALGTRFVPWTCVPGRHPGDSGKESLGCVCSFGAKGQATGRERCRDTWPTQLKSSECVALILAPYCFAWGFQGPRRSRCL